MMLFRRLFYCLCLACSVCVLRVADAADAASPSVAVLRVEDAIDAALSQNLGLITARYRPAQAQASVVIEASSFDPSLFGSLSMGESQAAASSSSLDSVSTPQSERRGARVGVEKRLSTGAVVTVDTNISRNSSNNNAARNPDYSTDVGVSLRQPLWKDGWGRVNLAPLVRARASAAQSIFELRSDILDVIAEAEIAYWNLAYAKAERALIESGIELAENLLEENRERERLGLVTGLEVLQAEAEWVKQQEAKIEAERAIEDAADGLRRVMGTRSFLDAAEDAIRVLPMPTELASLRPMDVVVQDAIYTDADAKAQEKAIEVERINRMLAQDATRPDLDLTGGVEYRGRDADGRRAYGGAYHADGYRWDVGLEVRYPWGFRAARARVRQAEYSHERALVQLYDLKQEKALAARKAWRAASSGLKRIEVTKQSLALNEETFAQERARYGSGLVAYRRVLEAQRDYDRARSNYLSALVGTLRAEVRLSRIDGTLLARHGFDWSLIDPLGEAPDLEGHPFFEQIENNP